jgi:hypothetical protein
LDILGVDGPANRPLDGVSLLPFLSGDMAERPQAAGIGIHGIFGFGETNHHVSANGTTTYPDICPNVSDALALGDVPTNFSTVGNQPQFSWAEGNDLKLFGCSGKCTGANCNSTAPGYYNKGWRFFLFNLTADRSETTDLWKARRPVARAMFERFQAWQASVRISQGPTENACNPPAPPVGPKVPITPVPGMQNVKKRCTATNGNKVGQVGSGTPQGCALECKKTADEAAATATAVYAAAKAGVRYEGFGRDPDETCGFFSFSKAAGECWLFKECTALEGSPAFVYTWSTYKMGENSVVG